MDNTYVITKTTITEALDQIDKFESKMILFKEKHPKYKYNVKLIPIDDVWEIQLNISNEDEK